MAKAIRMNSSNIEERFTAIIMQMNANLMVKEFDVRRAFIPFIFLRRLDCILQPYYADIKDLYLNLSQVTPEADLEYLLHGAVKGHHFFNVSGLSLSALLTERDQQVFDNLFNRYITGFNSSVKEILNLFDFDRIVADLRKVNRLYIMVQEIVELPLEEDNISQSELIIFFNHVVERYFRGTPMNNDSYTNRSIIKLVGALLFRGEASNLECHSQISIYDPVCGTGGMLYESEQFIKQEVCTSEICPMIMSYGQDLDDFSLAIAKAIELMLGNNPDNIKKGNTLTDDKFRNEKFDFILANLPYGMSWKAELKSVAMEALEENGRFKHGIPTSSNDSQMLFMQHMIDKMNPSGSKMAVITSTAPLNAGAIGSGENNIRTWIADNDILDAIIALPENLLHYTSIPTYLWIFNNKKSDSRKGRITLIDAKNIFFTPRNSRVRTFSDRNIDDICRLFNSPESNDSIAKSIPTKEFGSYQITMVEKATTDGEKDKLTEYILPLDANILEYADELIANRQNSDAVVYLDQRKTRIGYSFNFSKFFTKETQQLDTTALIGEVAALKQSIEENTARLLDLTKPIDMTLVEPYENERLNAMRKTNLYWAPEVPELYNVLPVKSIFEIRLGRHDVPTDPDGEYPVFGANGVKDNSNEYNIDGDYILIGRTGSAGKVNYFSGKGNLSQGVYGLTLQGEGILKYFYYQLLQVPMEQFVSGATIKALNRSELEHIRLIVPPLDVQKAVVEHLDAVYAEADAISEQLKSQLETIEKLKSAVSTATLFGK